MRSRTKVQYIVCVASRDSRCLGRGTLTPCLSERTIFITPYFQVGHQSAIENNAEHPQQRNTHPEKPALIDDSFPNEDRVNECGGNFFKIRQSTCEPHPYGVRTVSSTGGSRDGTSRFSVGYAWPSMISRKPCSARKRDSSSPKENQMRRNNGFAVSARSRARKSQSSLRSSGLLR